MDGDGSHPPAAASVQERRNIQVDNAIRAIREKKPLPEIDFTIHTLEDGTQVRTSERVCKGTRCPGLPLEASSSLLISPELPSSLGGPRG